MLKLAEVDGSPIETHPLLDRIAKALDCPVGAFSELSSYDAQTAELMHLWLTIDYEQDRAKVLSFLRSIASTEATQQNR